MKTPLRAIVAGTCLASLGLVAACNRPAPTAQEQSALSETALPPLPASVPLELGPATPLVVAPEAERLPAAPRPALRRLVGDYADYAYLDRAAYYDDAFFDAPPDYAFDYDGVSPWGWEGYDGEIAYVEPIDDGYRYYYYEAGDDAPYLVRDPYYSYAFDGPALVVIYDNAGRVLPPHQYGPRWDYAGRYFARGRGLRAAARHDRRGAIAANWAAQRAQIAASNAAWDATRSRDVRWTAYHDRTDQQQRAHWQRERQARAQAARQFAEDQRRGFTRRAPDVARNARGDRDRPAYMIAPDRPRGGRDDATGFSRRFDERQRADASRAFAQDRRDQRRAQADQVRFERRQQMEALREQRQQARWQRPADRPQEMRAQREQQRAQRQQVMQVQRDQQRSQRQQAMQAQRDQQRAQRQQVMQEQRDQQRSKRQQAMQGQREQQRAQRQQVMQSQRQQRQAQNQPADQPGGGRGHGRGRDRN